MRPVGWARATVFNTDGMVATITATISPKRSHHAHINLPYSIKRRIRQDHQHLQPTSIQAHPPQMPDRGGLIYDHEQVAISLFFHCNAVRLKSKARPKLHVPRVCPCACECSSSARGWPACSQNHMHVYPPVPPTAQSYFLLTFCGESMEQILSYLYHTRLFHVVRDV